MMKQVNEGKRFTVAELSEATGKLKLWRLQTQTRRAEDLATKARIRGAETKRASEAK